MTQQNNKKLVHCTSISLSISMPSVSDELFHRHKETFQNFSTTLAQSLGDVGRVYGELANGHLVVSLFVPEGVWAAAFIEEKSEEIAALYEKSFGELLS
jgi:hypothetical protein